MLVSIFILVLTHAFSIISSTNQFQVASGSAISEPLILPEPAHRNFQENRNQNHKRRIWKPSRTQREGPTHVSKHHKLQSHVEQDRHSHKRHDRRDDPYKQARIYRALMECLTEAQKQTRNIRAIFAEKVDYSNSEKIAWTLLQELRAILSKLRECLERIKDGNMPVPSNLPGFLYRPSLIDICTVMAEILTELRVSFQAVSDLSRKFPIFQNICGDTLNQISATLANIIIESSGKLGNVIRVIARIFQATPGFFQGIGNGFGNIPAIIVGSGHSRDFGKFM